MSGAGLDLGTGEYRVEANAFLESRLRLVFAFVLGAAVFFYLLGYTTTLIEYGTAAANPWRWGRWIHLLGIGGLGSAYWRLRTKGPFGERALNRFDAFLVLGTVATCFGLYAHSLGKNAGAELLTITALLVVARGVAVPSTARRTLLLSSSAPLVMLAIRLWRPIDDPHPYLQLVWVLVVQCLAVALATFASLVNFRLREQVREARTLGQYVLDEKLGEGAMGTVHRAHHRMLRRPTAIKILRPELAGEETVARFEREVQGTAQLQHPNTIAIYDYGHTPDGLFYYAMELLDGENLAEVLERSGPLEPARAIHVLRQVCGSLHEAHTQGLVHRDIKLGNIVLCRRAGLHDVVKVLDFGLVKDLRNTGVNLTQVGALCGTPETIAPEVLSGEPAGAAADIYAIGIVAYQLLTGTLPFEAKTAAELIAAHLHADPIPLAQRDASIPGDLAAVVESALAKDPKARPASAAAFADRLRSCADGAYRDGAR